MKIGTGSLAKLLKDRKGAVFFCSGVGNSSCKDYDHFYREESMLVRIAMSIETDKTLFYFSSIIKPVNEYGIHKHRMELVVKNTCKHYNIIRLGNIWECTNPNTFLNYLRAHPEAEVRDEIKYMIHAEELNMICQSLPLTGKHEISIFSEMLTVKECLKR